jgi:hypothetical protein
MKIYSHKFLLVAVPFPLEIVVTTGNALKATALKKARGEAKLMKLKTGKILEYEFLGYEEKI